MELIKVLRQLQGAGISIERKDAVTIRVVKSGPLCDSERQLIRDHKFELLAFIEQAEQTAADLVEAAMDACDHHHDDREARIQMRIDVESTPPNLRQDLLAHFEAAYRRKVG